MVTLPLKGVHTIRDQLRLIQKGTKFVAEYGRLFETLCDQLAAIGHPVDESDQLHWILCGLGPSFETFSTSIRSARPVPSFADLLARTESHELFYQALHRSSSPTVAFTATHQPPPSAGRGRGGRSARAPNETGGRGRGRRPPHCQLCRTNGYYANKCPQLPSFASQSPVIDDNLAKAFVAQCHVGFAAPDWYVDSSATDHMTATTDNVTNVTPALGTNFVTFGNNESLPISHTGSSHLLNNVVLNDVLVVPRLTKNLLSVSKLTRDNHVDVLLSHPNFFVQDRTTKQVLAQGKCDQGLYVLHSSPQALIASNKTPRASFETWHSRLGHVNFDTLFSLNKRGLLSFTALLPKPGVCLSCQMAKSHKLPFELNHKRASNPLELIHCDVWGPSPVESHDNFRYYIVFVDDHSRFSWLYPLSRKSDVYKAIEVFILFVQTQFSCKIKVFQSDGGTEFVNHRVRDLFEANGTLHRLSCPYTPPQNARAERKHRHIVETGLAMLFNANLPSIFWVDAFTSAVHIINRLPTKVLDGKSPFEMLYKRSPDYNTF
ncbi:retrovirus-related pol polyprotein from transposon TNT 1-94 [Tanacetum coccineum]